MLARLSLRQRILLFFAFLAAGGIGSVILGLIVGYQRADDPALQSPLITAGLIAGFLIAGLVVFVWLLFDENVAKPIERLAADMRSRAHADVASALDAAPARYLGDLGPAALALSTQLGSATMNAAQDIARRTSALEAEKARLSAILSDIPVAVVMIGADHRISLYDGHAAASLDALGPVALGQSIFDYFAEGPLRAAIADLVAQEWQQTLSFELPLAENAKGWHVTLHRLGKGAGYMLSFPPEAGIRADRPLAFDFSAALTNPGRDVMQTPLRDLVFVVLDTETTGLLPTRDDIVQVGAVRLVRLVPVAGEEFDTLVDPGRAIPATSTKVHGISTAMVQGAPGIGETVRRFHRYARNAVLVAHNAPFDLAFLHRYGKSEGLEFDNPVLDTVLLSAVLFGASAGHTLDDLAGRLDIEIKDADRHTAMGDARATAAVLIKMIPLLESRGIVTFAQVREEMRRHRKILPDLNEKP